MNTFNDMKTWLRGGAAVFALTVGTSGVAQAAVLVDWDFSDLVNGGGSNGNAVGVALDNSQSNAAAGLTVTDMVGVGTLEYTDANDADDELNVFKWDGDGQGVASNGNPNGFLRFTITADVADSLNISSISVSQWRNGGGAPPNIGFRVSVDGGSTTIYDAYQTDSTSGDFGFDTFTFTQAITGADSVVIDFAPVGAVGTRGDGNLHINALSVNGEVAGAVIPEPASLVLLGLGGVGLLARRRRSQG